MPNWLLLGPIVRWIEMVSQLGRIGEVVHLGLTKMEWEQYFVHLRVEVPALVGAIALGKWNLLGDFDSLEPVVVDVQGQRS